MSRERILGIIADALRFKVRYTGCAGRAAPRPKDAGMPIGQLRAVEQPRDAIAERPLRVLYEYWREAAAGRAFLPNGELRPERFAPAMQHIAIVEQVAAPRRGLRIRLCGSDIENQDFGIARGNFLEDARPPWYRDHLMGEVAAALARAAPIHQRVEAEIDNKRFTFTRLMLPLSTTGAGCDLVMVATVRPSDQIVDAIRARRSLA